MVLSKHIVGLKKIFIFLMLMNMPNSAEDSLKILVCGAGSIGVRHINNLQYLGIEVLVWRSRGGNLNKLKDEFGVKTFPSVDDALINADAVVIATVTSKHIELALKAAKLGKHIFIEKPISNNTNGLNELKKLVQKNKLVFEVGCQLRSHPNLKILSQTLSQNDYGPLYTYRAVVGQRLEDWRPGTDYTKSYSAKAHLGGGALLDLIHEIDLLYWITGSIDSVYASLTKVSDQLMSSEDLVNITLKNSNGAQGQLQLDMVSPEYRRSMELVYKEGVFFWDYIAGTLIYKSNGCSVLLDKVPDDFNRNSLFISHMKHFIKRINNPNISPLCSIDDGIAALCIAQAARLSSSQKRDVNLMEIEI
jgi:predicted dehydrogenase